MLIFKNTIPSVQWIQLNLLKMWPMETGFIRSIVSIYFCFFFHSPPDLVWRLFLFASTGHLFTVHVADERKQNENDLLRGKLSVQCTQYYALHGFQFPYDGRPVLFEMPMCLLVVFFLHIIVAENPTKNM